MLRTLIDAYADAVGWVMMVGLDYPAHTIGAVALAVGFVVVYNHRNDLVL